VCEWTASVDVPWITITSGGSGTGNGTITYSVEANVLSASRTGHITVGNAVHTVIQAGFGDYVLESADFARFAPTGVQPGTVLDCERTMSGPETSQPMWLEFFASRTGGFDLLRVGGTVTQSYKLDEYPGGTRDADVQTRESTGELAAGWDLYAGAICEPSRDGRSERGGVVEQLVSDCWEASASTQHDVAAVRPIVGGATDASSQRR